MEAARKALDRSRPGDLVVLCVDYATEVFKELESRRSLAAPTIFALDRGQRPGRGVRRRPRPARRLTPMEPARVREVLERTRDELRAELATLTAAPRDPMGAVSFGKRVGEGTSQAVERIAQVDAAKQLDAKLGDVERALEKLDEGTYGSLRRLRLADRSRAPRGDPLGRSLHRPRRRVSLRARPSAEGDHAVRSGRSPERGLDDLEPHDRVVRIHRRRRALSERRRDPL